MTMPVHRGQDRCSECKTPLPDEGPCPQCGSTKRTVPLSVQTVVAVSGSVNRRLLISWQEVDRLLSKTEYAAALLVAAVNVEFILWENLRRFTPSTPLDSMPRKVRRSWIKICGNKSESFTLGRLLGVTEFLTQRDMLALSPSWDPLAREINEVRRKIAHELGYFERLTQLKEPDWPESRIRQVLEDAKEFCHGNAP
jgi:hypothetical protein